MFVELCLLAYLQSVSQDPLGERARIKRRATLDLFPARLGSNGTHEDRTHAVDECVRLDHLARPKVILAAREHKLHFVMWSKMSEI